MRIERNGPLGCAQEWEWWLQALADGDPDRPGAAALVRIPVPARADAGSAERALRAMVERHESLRSFLVTGDDGRPRQAVHPVAELRVEFLDSASPAQTEAFHERLRAAAAGYPGGLGTHAGIVREDGRATEIALAVGHCFFDATSMYLLIEEFRRLLAGIPLPEATAQPIDLAAAERSEARGNRVAAARKYWLSQLGSQPNRMFVPVSGGVLVHQEVDYRSDSAPAALQLVARRLGTSPAVVVEALLHVLLAPASGRERSVIRSHYSGRDKDAERSIGCFHSILPAIVDLSDRPPFTEVVRRTANARMRSQRFHRVDYLGLREIMCAEERERGIAFADGVILNFFAEEGYAELARRPEQELFAAATAGGSTTTLTAFGEVADDRGFDGYFTVEVGERLSVCFKFNADTIAPRQAVTLIEGLDRALDRLVRGEELDWAGFDRFTAPEQAGQAGQAARDGQPGQPEAALRALDAFSPAALRAAIAGHPAVAAVELTLNAATGPVPGQDQPQRPELVALVTAVPGSRLDGPALREHVLALLHPARGLICPDRFVVTGAAGPAADGAADDGALHALLYQAARLNGWAEAADPDLGYTAARGSLALVPGIVRGLAAAGWSGLRPGDFQRPAGLRTLAAALVRVDAGTVDAATEDLWTVVPVT